MSHARLTNYLSTIPICSLGLLSVNCIVHLFIFLTSEPLNLFSINPYLVIYNYEFYRIISSAFVHSGLLHIFFNMMSLLQIGTILEIQFGTLQFLVVTLWLVILSSTLYVLFSYILSLAFNNISWLYYSSVGFSGVLFSYAIIETYHSNMPTRSVFGLFEVPSKVYPWVLLVILQIMLPNVSWLGHVSGIIVGLLLLSGSLQFLLPSVEFYKSIEQSTFCSNYFVRLSNYVRTPDYNMTYPNFYVCGPNVPNPILMIFVQLWNIIETLLYIFGLTPANLQYFYQSISSLFARTPSVNSDDNSTIPLTERSSPFDSRGSFQTLRQNEDNNNNSVSNAIKNSKLVNGKSNNKSVKNPIVDSNISNV